MSKAPFPIDAHLTAIAVAYKNTALIADEVLPIVPVGKQEFKYMKYNLADGFTIPDSKVGRKSAPNQVEFSATEATDSTADYALDDVIPVADIENAPPNYNPVQYATEQIMALIKLGREKRAADLVFAAGNYGSSNKATLSGNDQWSDFTNSDPIKAILNALDACVMRPNIMVLGQAAWSVLRRHPKIVKAVNASGADAGVASRQAVADLLELQQILVGQSYLNTAKKGQTASVSRIWGKHAALIYRENVAGVQGGVTFGFTARWGSPIAGQFEDKKAGMRGGIVVRAGESVKELITANDLGYLFTNAVA